MSVVLLGLCILGLPLTDPAFEAGAGSPVNAPAEFVLQPNAPAKSLRSNLKAGKWKPVALQMGNQKVPDQILAENMPDHIQFSDERMTAAEGGKPFANVPYELD